MEYLVYFVIAWFFTVLIETIVLLFILRKFDRKKVIVLGVGASTITLPFVWFVFPLLSLSYLTYIVAAELFVWFLEALIYFWWLKKIKWHEALIYSLIANVCSFAFGLVLWLFL